MEKPEKKADPLFAVTQLKKAREACLEHLAKLRDNEDRSLEDLDNALKVLEKYLDTIAIPMQEAFNKKLELLTPELNKALAAFSTSNKIKLDKSGIKDAMKGESPHKALNDILSKFYKQNISPKHQIDQEIIALEKIRTDIKKSRQEMS